MSDLAFNRPTYTLTLSAHAVDHIRGVLESTHAHVTRALDTQIATQQEPTEEELKAYKAQLLEQAKQQKQAAQQAAAQAKEEKPTK